MSIFESRLNTYMGFIKKEITRVVMPPDVRQRAKNVNEQDNGAIQKFKLRLTGRVLRRL